MEYREKAVENLNNETATLLLAKLCEQLSATSVGLTDAVFNMAVDVCQLEQQKQLLLEDLHKKGVIETYRNGRQSVTRPNKSLERVEKIMDQQSKILEKLGLTPKRKVSAEPAEETDPFEEF